MILICVPSGMYRPSAYSSIQPRCRADGWALMVMDGMRWLSLRVRSCCIYECQVIDGSSPDSAWQILRAAATQPAALQLERLRAQETLLPRPSNRRPDGWRSCSRVCHESQIIAPPNQYTLWARMPNHLGCSQ